MSSAVDAGRIMLERIHQLRDQNESFAFETTLAGRSYVPFLRDAQDRGYLIHVVFVWISSVELARYRVAVRVRQGGHDVPPQDIERRYWRGLKNFFQLYRPLADTWTLCDNSGDALTVIARGSRDREPMVFNAQKFGTIQRMATYAAE